MAMESREPKVQLHGTWQIKDIAVQRRRRAGTTDPSSREERRQQHTARVIDEGSTRKPGKLTFSLANISNFFFFSFTYLLLKFYRSNIFYVRCSLLYTRFNCSIRFSKTDCPTSSSMINNQTWA